MPNRETFAEKDLYEPIKRMLTAQGFVVKGEVKNCDIAAVRDDALWIVEMKLSFNMTLLFQAMDRLTMTNDVFVAIPRPKRTNDKNFVKAKKILQKLELGLITVALGSPINMAEIILFPGGKPKKVNKANTAIRKEIAGRTGDSAGGTTGTVVNTAFRERSIKLACALEINGSMNAPALIKQYHCEKDAYKIMFTNYYGWFTRTGRGQFALSGEGHQYLKNHASDSVVAYYRMQVSSMDFEDSESGEHNNSSK